MYFFHRCTRDAFPYTIVLMIFDIKRYAQRYCELIEEDGCHYEELYKRCKEKLLKLSPKLYYAKFPKQVTVEEELAAWEDMQRWEAEVKSTDAEITKAKEEKAGDEGKGKEGQGR
jgi:hypothetical protein